MTDTVSIIIPARNERYLQATINDVFKKAAGPVQVIAVLDGYWPQPPLTPHPQLIQIHHTMPQGMRPAINAGVATATGQYVMKLDAHCLLAEGFDEALKADCAEDWIVVPRRRKLDPERWQVADGTMIDHEYVTCPADEEDIGQGMRGRRWNDRTRERADILIDDLMAFQGSCWFMPRDYFYALELMDWQHWGLFFYESQELAFKAWLSGGRCVVNKKTYYAHWHKPTSQGRGYALPQSEREAGWQYVRRFVYEGRPWPQQTRDFQWLIEHFAPIPGWHHE